MKETHFDGSRSWRNFALDRQTEPLVLDSEISGLDNLHAYLKHGNYVARFSFSAMEIPATKPKFIERLKDDYIVREPVKEPSAPVKAAPHTAVSAPAAVNPGNASTANPAPAVEAIQNLPHKEQTEFAFGPKI